MSGRSFASRWSEGWHIVPWQITWRDLDAAGHVNNAVYLSLFELGRTRYWTEMAGTIDTASIGFIVARAEIDFVRQLSLGEEIDIATRVEQMRNSSFDFSGEIRNGQGEVAARGKVIVVYFSYAENRKERIPDEVRNRVAEWQGGGV